MINLTDVAFSIAHIASETEDSHTARQLVNLIYELLAEVGLPVLSQEADCPEEHSVC